MPNGDTYLLLLQIYKYKFQQSLCVQASVDTLGQVGGSGSWGGSREEATRMIPWFPEPSSLLGFQEHHSLH